KAPQRTRGTTHGDDPKNGPRQPGAGNGSVPNGELPGRPTLKYKGLKRKPSSRRFALRPTLVAGIIAGSAGEVLRSGRRRSRRTDWRNTMSSSLATLLAVAVGAAQPAAGNLAPPAPGAPVANFTLKDIHRRERSLDGFRDQKALVLVFVGTEC